MAPCTGREPSCGQDDRGFTLIELLVVVIIVGILAAIAIPTFLSMRERGYQAQLTSDVRNAILDIEAIAVLDEGFYPASRPAFTTSTADITLDYYLNGDRTSFCVQGTHALLTQTPQVAHYLGGSGGVQVFETCPPGLVLVP